MPNSSAPSAAPLHLILKQSPTLNRFIFVVHGLAGFAALANPLPVWIKASLFMAVALSLYFTYRNHVLDPAVRELSLSPDGEWKVMCRSGTVFAQLADGSVVTRWLVILHLIPESGGKLAVPILRDSLDAESFRRLRVHLRVVGSKQD
ncbi:protein YgfX [Methylomagnum sp.]